MKLTEEELKPYIHKSIRCIQGETAGALAEMVEVDIDGIEEALLTKLKKIKPEDLREGIAKILWTDRWGGKGMFPSIPFDTKGEDKRTEWEWDRERERIRKLASHILSIISIWLVVKMETAENKGFKNGYITGYNKAKQEGVRYTLEE